MHMILMLALGCSAGKDSGSDSMDVDSGTTDSGTTDPGNTTTPDVVDSCNWPDAGICFEYTNYADTSTWCTDIGTKYSFATSYAATPCDTADVVGACAIPSGNDFKHEAVAYYYSPKFDAGKADGACSDAGGVPR